MDQKQERLPPYVSYLTWKKLLDGLEKFLPEVIDSSYYAGLMFSGSSARKLRTALRFLSLENASSVPTDKLKRLVRALRGEGEESKAQILRNILYDAYPSMFTGDFNIKRAKPGQLAERFEKLGVRGDIQRQCISFFLHMAVEAKEELSQDLAGRSRMGTGRKSDALKSRERKRKLLTQQSKTTQLRGDEGFDWLKLHPAILALLKDLATRGASWDAEEKAKFKKAFEAVFDIAYPNDRHGSK